MQDALQEVRHARKMVTYGREYAFAAEISQSRADMRNALALAERALQAQIYSLMTESEDEE